MSNFKYKISNKKPTLFVEDLNVIDILKKYHTTHAFIYSKQDIINNIKQFKSALDNINHLICYAVKANSNLSILNLIKNEGLGFDIVSIGELKRVLKVGAKANKIVFSGVAKSEEEIKYALKIGIKVFNVESISELKKINEVAGKLKLKAPISLRINPDVNAKTHPYISTGLKENKFGLSIDKAVEYYKLARSLRNIEIIGIDCHIGSQITCIEPYLESIDKLIKLLNKLKQLDINIKHIDIGGGFGVKYFNEEVPNINIFISTIKNKIKPFVESNNLEVIFEPGRSIIANTAILVSQIRYIKSNEYKNFAIITTGMNDIIRPSLYKSYMNIIPIIKQEEITERNYDIVGPICETGDCIGSNRSLKIKEHDYIAITCAGAYTTSMSSNYNSQPKAIEILVDNNKSYLIRKAEKFNDIWRNELVINFEK